MLERAFAARFGGADIALGHPLSAGHRAAAAVPADAPAAATAPNGQPSDMQSEHQQPAQPDVPQPAGTILAPTTAPEGGSSKDPDAPRPEGGRVPRGGPMAPVADVGTADAAFADPAAQLTEQAAVSGAQPAAEAAEAAAGGAAAGADGGGEAAAAVAPIQLSGFCGSGDSAVLVQPDGPDGQPDPTQVSFDADLT